MITTIDESAGEVVVRDGGVERRHPLCSAEGFAAVSRVWLRAGWDAKYVYSFTWLGRPIIQLPEDIVRIQEVIYALKPDVIVETGVAHGGGLVFYASLLKLIGAGRVIGIDIEIRPHNRAAIEAHELSPWITLIEGSSIDPTTLENLKELLRPDEKTLVVLDSKHSYDHVTAELERYAPLVGVGSYVVVCDGIMEQVAGGPRTQADWTTDNPRRAVIDFAARNKNFAIREPAWRFNEGLVSERVSYWPDAYLLRIA